MAILQLDRGIIMTIIQIDALPNGAHDNQTINDMISLPEGWAAIPEEIPIPNTFPFVGVEVEGGTVTALLSGVTPDPDPEPIPIPTPDEDRDALLVDLEYRTTLLELGVI